MNRLHRRLVLAVLPAMLLAACGGQPAAQNEDAAGQTAEPAEETGELAEETEPAEQSEPVETADVGLTGDVSIMAPADPGGGWDATARAMQEALGDAGLVDGNVEVYNVGGAGGTVGLAEFASDRNADPSALMVSGLVMVGAILTNDAPVTLDEVRPLAALTTEYQAIVVPADSPYETFEQLVEDFKSDPRSISWGGGSAGGTDHMLVGLIAQEVGVAPGDINYIAHAGGGEAMASILSGAVSAGVSSVSEFVDQVEGGQLRFLAVSSAEPIEGVDSPTLFDAGVDIELANWRGVMAPGGISDDQYAALSATIEAMSESPEWQEALERNGWTPFVKVGDEFASFVDDEEARVEQVLIDIGLLSS